MEEFYTIEEVSNILALTRQTVSKYIKEGKINAVKLGKSYRIYKKDFVNFINQHSIVSDNIIKYDAVNYEGFGF